MTKQTFRTAGYSYIKYLGNGQHHIIDDNTGNHELWFSNKGHASFGLIYKNTHLEFAHSIDIKKHIINHDDAVKLFSIEEDNLSPLDKPYDENEYNKFIDEMVGMTLWDYSAWRNPDEPESEFELNTKILF